MVVHGDKLLKDFGAVVAHSRSVKLLTFLEGGVQLMQEMTSQNSVALIPLFFNNQTWDTWQKLQTQIDY